MRTICANRHLANTTPDAKQGQGVLGPSSRQRVAYTRWGVGKIETDLYPSTSNALELTLLLADRGPEKYERAAARWHRRFAQEVPHVDLRESLAVIALLAAIPANRLAAAALAELLSRRRSCERIAEALVRWSRAA
jgi:hypothetical protein